ncbi:dipicolinate synthase subunit DpsA [Oscillospiraceae bacterium MB08-C2-2]|nr:dipicolinate synthase subunit DpsA [Oscillospiraceae bacterium MB08-C2-2]
MKNKTIAVIGGDLRQTHLAGLLAQPEKKNTVYAMFMESDMNFPKGVIRSNALEGVLPKCDIVIFPLPLLGTDGYINTPLTNQSISFEQCLYWIPPTAAVLGGMIPASLMEEAAKKGIELLDFFCREEFAVRNAWPTAEGTIEIALRELPTTLYGQVCLITGYGRISKVLARLLQAFGAQVRVAARKYSDLAWIQVSKALPVPMEQLSDSLEDVDLLVNTVPTRILGEKELSRLKSSCLVIDLASKPGGVDFETAKNLGIKTIWALSLPGKTAPITAGEIILDTVTNILTERGTHHG